MKNYLHLASNGLGFNESGVRFYAGTILLPKNPYPLNFNYSAGKSPAIIVLNASGGMKSSCQGKYGVDQIFLL